MGSVEAALARCGGVAPYAALEAEGVSRAAVKAALRSGRVVRVRNGWFALESAPEAVVRAVRVGGVLTCLSVLRLYSIWCVDDRRLHVSVDRHANHLSSPYDRAKPLGRQHEVTVHRRSQQPTSTVDSVHGALKHAFFCQERENVIVSLDSALNSGRITREELEDIGAGLPAKYKRYLDLVDASAQSGLETKARLRLRRWRIRYRAQVRISGVGQVDLLIGDRLVLELDGQRWHTGAAAYEEDRRRDLLLHELGYIVVRVSYNQVMQQWDAVERVVRGYVSRNEHRWAARHHRAGLAQ